MLTHIDTKEKHVFGSEADDGFLLRTRLVNVKTVECFLFC